jgi:hypothetical protein
MRRVGLLAFSGTLVVVLATVFAAVAVAVPAWGDDPGPLPLVPSGVTASPGPLVSSTDAPQTLETHLPGPTVSLSPPSQQQIDDAREALDRMKRGGATSTSTPLVQVAAPKKDHSVAPRISAQGWWTIGAALMVLLVASEATRISVRRAKHRKGA